MPDVTFGPQDGQRLPCREGDARTEYREVASGLRLRVTRGGARTWNVVYWSTVAKAARRLKLGDAVTMPLSKARAAARAAIHAVEQDGRDPQAERAVTATREREARARRAEERAIATRKRRGATFGKVCERYVEHRRTTASGKYNRRARPNTLALWRGMLDHYILPGLGARRPEDITSEDFLCVLEDAVKRGGSSMGPRVRELLSATWRWAEQRPRDLGINMPAVSPLVGLSKVGAAQKERERALSPAEVWRFWRATEAEEPAAAALRLTLLTATRVREATELPWTELDLPAATWRLPAARSKGGSERVIPLSPQAVALLRRTQSEDPNVFPGAIAALPGTMRRLRAAVAGEPWQSRDLRRTAATMCARLGADPFVVALVLGHARADARVPAVTAGYLRWRYEDRVREALNRLGAWVEETAALSTEPGDVVTMGAHGRA